MRRWEGDVPNLIDLFTAADRIEHLEKRMNVLERQSLHYDSLRGQIQSLHRMCNFLADQVSALATYLDVIICYDLKVDVNGHYVARPARPVEEAKGGTDDNRD
jgi:hypothetical protein